METDGGVSRSHEATQGSAASEIWVMREFRTVIRPFSQCSVYIPAGSVQEAPSGTWNRADYDERTMMFRRFPSPPSFHSLLLHLLLHHLLLGLLLQAGPHGVQGVHRRSRLLGNTLRLRGSFKDINANLKPEETENGILRTKTSVKTSSGKINRNATRDNRVVGGQPIEKNAYPYLVSIFRTSTGKHSCGGVMICKRWIITAAHCFYSFGNGDATQAKNNIGVRLGAHNLSDTSENNCLTMDLDTTFNHPNYSRAALSNDIALGRLSSPVDITHAIQPACLADSTTENHTGDTVSVIGWGTTTYKGWSSDVPLMAQAVMISRDDCQEKYPGKTITDDMICAFEQGKDACQGDSGGPLVLPSNLTSKVLGLVSWGEGCGQNPGVYTSVAKHLAWIKKEVDCDVCTR
ncbi:trypsin-like [Oratosquilla oratoria]|uniref:trypsin-like n=1 Tax=Oratosquilla oratoria TaxID=337810 RepID=UPI003F76207D